MAQLAIATAFAVVGNAIVPGIGGQIGFAIGSMVGASLTAPDIQGPRVDDLRIQLLTYGAPIARVYGTDRVAGSVIWSTDLIESESESGGKGGPEVTNYSYSVSCAVAIAEGEVSSLRRIWADAKLIYDARSTATDEAKAESAKFRQYWVLHPGSETQDPDPTIESVEGAGNAPAYRGTAYIVFTQLPLAEFGNRIPSFSFEIAADIAEVADDPGAAILREPLRIYPWAAGADGRPVHSLGDTNYQPWSEQNVADGTDFEAKAAEQALTFFNDGANTFAWGADLAGAMWTGLFYLPMQGSPYRILNTFTLGGVERDPQYVNVLTARYEADKEPAPYWMGTEKIDINHEQFWGAFQHVSDGYGGSRPLNYAPQSWRDYRVFPFQPYVPNVPWRTLAMIWPYYDQNIGLYSAPMMIWRARDSHPDFSPRPGQVSIPFTQTAYGSYYSQSNPDQAETRGVSVPVLDTSWMNYVMDMREERLPTHPLKTCYPGEDPCTAPTGAVEIPSNPDWCVLCDGTVTPNRTWTIVTGTAKQLAAVEYRLGELYQNGLGPVLLTTDPDYANSAYWDAAATAAIAAGTMQADVTYPVVVTSWAESDASDATTYTVPSPADNRATLSAIVAAICADAGLTAGQIDVTELTDGVIGYTRTRRMAARAALEPLRAAFAFDAVESGDKIVFRKRARASVASITSEDLGAGNEQAAPEVMQHERAQESELPNALTVSYRSFENDYQPGTQQARRRAGESDQQATMELPVVLTDDEARQVAEVLLYSAWVARNKRTITVTRKWAKVEPTDIIEVDDGDL